jgi:hypothetical protein
MNFFSLIIQNRESMCGETENFVIQIPPMRYNVPDNFSPILHMDLKCLNF